VLRKQGELGKKLLKKKETTTKIECPEDKILNPETNKCVKKTGRIGKKLMKKAETPRRFISPRTRPIVRFPSIVKKPNLRVPTPVEEPMSEPVEEPMSEPVEEPMSEPVEEPMSEPEDDDLLMDLLEPANETNESVMKTLEDLL